MNVKLSMLALLTVFACTGGVDAASSQGGAAAAGALAAAKGDLKIMITSPEGKPLAGVYVEVTASRGDGVAMRRKSGPGGLVSLTGLAAGEYLVVAFAADGSDFSWRMARVIPGDGVTVSLSLPPVKR